MHCKFLQFTDDVIGCARIKILVRVGVVVVRGHNCYMLIRDEFLVKSVPADASGVSNLLAHLTTRFRLGA
jgi:hypothetical protein